jgi:hypothetical protein
VIQDEKFRKAPLATTNCFIYQQKYFLKYILSGIKERAKKDSGLAAGGANL